MSLPPPNTPLYNHPLPEIERWLIAQGCEQDPQEPHCWEIKGRDWAATLWLDIEQITVRYHGAGEDQQDIQRSFKYSLSRQDIEAAIFSGP
ncbi:DUF3143 domain-containing protein [Trichothermofontia sichuanensis B231]|uniref:DUF3143 domain-containing protein n=1 Tax=Trichothermofontia sichuanensis TaxID=3045816 RepID=UPI002247AF31|nr:DUF3143 domain-containing protein [Trichothermofontia sichuanensis]UZQ53823.1 DUF3143 domain-containing protein [Trichothermofontia sichuanensis B231]